MCIRDSSISVIDATRNVVAATIGVQHTPYSLDVSPDGKRAYVANSGSNTVSVIDLDKRRVIAAVGTGEGPGVARVSPDNRTLVVSNRVAGSISVCLLYTSYLRLYHFGPGVARNVFPHGYVAMGR